MEGICCYHGKKCCGSINQWHRDDYQEDCIVDDHPSLSSKDPFVYDIVDPYGKCDEDY